jgi:hypothetical protein
MKRICAWCGQGTLSELAEASAGDIPTHGICDACNQKHIAKYARPLQEFLDGLGVPVLVVSQACVVLAANEQAQQLLGKKLPLISGHFPGDVINCLHAKTPEGCGNTVHCRTCSIRSAVMDTFASGQPQCVEAYPDMELCCVVKRMRFRISTKKEDDVVLLWIDEISPDERRAV